MARKKTNQRLTHKDLLDLIAKQTSLTKEQCKEFSTAYNNLVRSLLISEYIEDGFEIPIFDIGVLKLGERKGLKIGDTYTVPDVYADEKTGRYMTKKDENGKIMVKTVVLDYNKPNYLAPNVKISPSLRQKIKEQSEIVYTKKHPEEFEL